MKMADPTLEGRSTLNALRARWMLLAVIGFAAVALGSIGLVRIESADYAAQWSAQAGLVLVLELWSVWKALGENRREGEDALLATLGPGNVLSLARGVLIALVAGFLLLPRPLGAWGWLPAILYVLADFTDFFDGYAARVSGYVTRLGERLDMNHDSAGVLAATLLAFQYGTVPWWYALFGFARYFFVFGNWIRKQRGLPVYGLPPNPTRRVFAAFQMGFVSAMLFPIFRPPATTVAATLFMLPFVSGFIYDWLHVSGRVGLAAKGNHQLRARIWEWLRDLAPVGLRVAAGMLMLSLAFQAATRAAMPWVILEVFCALALLMGWAVRITSVGGLMLLGGRFVEFGASPGLWVLLVGLTAILFLGPGRYYIWGPEEWFVIHRAGEKSE